MERALGPGPRLRSPPATGCRGRSLRPCSRWAPRPLGPGVPGWRCPRSPPARWSRSSSACRSAPRAGPRRLRPSPRCGRAPRALWCPRQGGGGSAVASGKAARSMGEPPTPFPHGGGGATAPVGSRVAVRSAASAGRAEPTRSLPAPVARHDVDPRRWQLGKCPCLRGYRGALTLGGPGGRPCVAASSGTGPPGISVAVCASCTAARPCTSRSGNPGGRGSWGPRTRPSRTYAHSHRMPRSSSPGRGGRGLAGASARFPRPWAA